MSDKSANVLGDFNVSTPAPQRPQDLSLTTDAGLQTAQNYKAPVDVTNPRAESILQDYEDSDKDPAPIIQAPKIEYYKPPIEAIIPDYDGIIKRIKTGEEIFLVKNSASVPLVLDWDIPLLPEDIKNEWQQYLGRKYVQYGLERFVGKFIMIAVFVEGRTVNFLEQFMLEKQIPTLIPVRAGKETRIKSCFVIQSNEVVLVTSEQIKSLAKYEQVKRTWDKADGGISESDWLGFLRFKKATIQDIEDSKNKVQIDKKVTRSFITTDDVMKSESPIDGQELSDRSQKRESGVIAAPF